MALAPRRGGGEGAGHLGLGNAPRNGCIVSQNQAENEKKRGLLSMHPMQQPTYLNMGEKFVMNGP